MEGKSSTPQEPGPEVPAQKRDADALEGVFSAEEIKQMTRNLDPALLALLGLC